MFVCCCVHFWTKLGTNTFPFLQFSNSWKLWELSGTRLSDGFRCKTEVCRDRIGSRWWSSTTVEPRPGWRQIGWAADNGRMCHHLLQLTLSCSTYHTVKPAGSRIALKPKRRWDFKWEIDFTKAQIIRKARRPESNLFMCLQVNGMNYQTYLSRERELQGF